ncbi:hypothetical protein ACFL2U_02865 [Patescibacteria group bacterium]
MNKIFKISIAISTFLIILGISNFALAAGKGYFLEVSNFVMLYNNVRVNGYLVVEQNLTDRAGKLGDLLVDEVLNLDKDDDLNFCTDQRDINSNAPQNLDCAVQDMNWVVDLVGSDYKSTLNIINDNIYQLTTNRILANSDILLNPGGTARVRTDDAVRVTGCIVNDGSDSCSGDSIKTNKIYLDDINFISKCITGSNLNKICNNDEDCGISGTCNYAINFKPDILNLGNIDIGDEENFINQNICYKIAAGQVCQNSPAIPGGSTTFQNENFLTYGCQNPASGHCVNGTKLCCFLKISDISW